MSRARCLLLIITVTLLGGCFKTELGGAVPGATITITELRGGTLTQDGLTPYQTARASCSLPMPVNSFNTKGVVL